MWLSAISRDSIYLITDIFFVFITVAFVIVSIIVVVAVAVLLTFIVVTKSRFYTQPFLPRPLIRSTRNTMINVDGTYFKVT